MSIRSRILAAIAALTIIATPINVNAQISSNLGTSDSDGATNPTNSMNADAITYSKVGVPTHTTSLANDIHTDWHYDGTAWRGCAYAGVMEISTAQDRAFISPGSKIFMVVYINQAPGEYPIVSGSIYSYLGMPGCIQSYNKAGLQQQIETAWATANALYGLTVRRDVMIVGDKIYGIFPALHS